MEYKRAAERTALLPSPPSVMRGLPRMQRTTPALSPVTTKDVRRGVHISFVANKDAEEFSIATTIEPEGYSFPIATGEEVEKCSFFFTIKEDSENCSLAISTGEEPENYVVLDSNHVLVSY